MDGFKTNVDVFKQLRSSGNSNLTDYASLTSSVVKKFKLKWNSVQTVKRVFAKICLQRINEMEKICSKHGIFWKEKWLLAEKYIYLTPKFISQIQNKVGELQLDSLQVSVTYQLLLIIGKIGFDGASGQSIYKQKFENTASDDQSVFMIAYVPLKLCMLNDQTNKIWVIYNLLSTR